VLGSARYGLVGQAGRVLAVRVNARPGRHGIAWSVLAGQRIGFARQGRLGCVWVGLVRHG